MPPLRKARRTFRSAPSQKRLVARAFYVQGFGHMIYYNSKQDRKFKRLVLQN